MVKSKVLVVMPAYNAEKTLEKTYQEIPKNEVDKIIVVDDASKDHTTNIAKKLKLKVIVHKKKLGLWRKSKNLL